MAKGSYLVQEANISPDSVVQFSVNDIALLGWDKTETNSDILRAKSIPTEHIWNPVPVGARGFSIWVMQGHVTLHLTTS